MTPADLVAAAARRFEAAGIAPDDSRRDAAVLARHLLDWDEAQWLTHRHEPASADFAGAFTRAADRRTAREPVAYITGQREFYARAFHVTPAVLVPRPETEIVVDEALAATRHPGSPERPVIVDVGTGSGCLAITLALELQRADVVAIDISEAALAVARQNAAMLRASRVDFIHGDLLERVAAPATVIVSNPPYVPERDRQSLPPEVRDFEPQTALFAGPDGLDVIRKIVPAAAACLVPRGWLIFEIGAGQDAAVRDLIATTAGLEWRHTAADLQGIPRVVVAQRS